MTTKQLKQVIGWGLTILVAIMPLHAFLVISLGHFAGHEPIWAAWKEILLIVLGALTVWLVSRDHASWQRLRQPIVYAAGAFAAVALLVTLIARPPLSTIVFGAKTDLEFIAASLIALVVADQNLVKRLVRTLLGATTLVVAFGLLQATILPHDILARVGYTFAPGHTAPYETVLVGNVTHTRFGSTLGGPNQLGTFLILPFILTLLFGLKRRIWWLYSLAILPVLFVSYSRGAWIGAVVAAIVAIVAVVPRRAKLATIAVIAALIVITVSIGVAGPSNNTISQYIHHSATTSGAPSSDAQHATSLRQGVHSLLAAPFGHGLGTAGPATFHGGNINIIENNYLQLGYETGVLGLLAFIGLVVLVAMRLTKTASLSAVATAAAIIGISVTALVLPAWTDSSTALTVWTLAGASLGARHV